MPLGIGRQRIAKNRIAGKSIAARYGLENLTAPQIFVAPGAATFTAPVAGKWKFHAWGPGGNGSVNGGGGSGAYIEISRHLKKGQTVALVVGTAGSSDTTVTIAGDLATAGRGASDPTGTGGAAGTASGGDVNINGSLGGGFTPGNAPTAGGGTAGGAAGTGNGSGAGAPGVTGFPGGKGGTVSGSDLVGYPPGGGTAGAATAYRGGGGLIIAYLERE